MNNNLNRMIFAVMITASFSAGAQGVYENVDQQGVVEFSDQASPGALQIDVRPNVVNVAPVNSAPPASVPGAAETPAGSMQPEVIREGAGGDYYGDEVNRREVRREYRERMDPGRDIARQPARGEPGKAAVRHGGGAHR